jgi:hypothetical protein
MTGLRPAKSAAPGEGAGTPPIDLDGICAAMDTPEMQGEPLVRRDYLLLGLVTIVVPLALILIGTLI